MAEKQTSPARAKRSGGKLRMMSRLPWTLVIILFLLITTLTETPMDGAVGYIFLGVGLFVMFVEFFKSGDITTTAYLLDLIVSTFCVATTAVLLTIMVIDTKQSLTFYHGYGAAIILLDAILGPFNSFRSAKRNVQFDDHVVS